MTDWTVYHIYYSDIDRLLCDVVQPAVEAAQTALDSYFWERHYAGGSHVRLHLKPNATEVHRNPEETPAIASLISSIRTYIDAHPSAPDPTYDAEQTANLMRMEGDLDADEDTASYLTYRVNEVVKDRYRRNTGRFVSDGAISVLETYYQEVAPILVRILRSGTPKRVQLFRLCVATCLNMKGQLDEGAVAFKSHWQGVANHERGQGIAEVIHKTYLSQKEGLHAHMREVQRLYDGVLHDGSDRGFEVGTLLHDWTSLLDRTAQRALESDARGEPIFDISLSDEWDAYRDRVLSSDPLNPFLYELFESRDFVATLLERPDTRALRLKINLLYLIIPQLGLRPVDRFAMGYFTYSSVEEALDVNLLDILRHRKETLLSERMA